MPSYTYQCVKCGRPIVLVRPIADRDDPQVNCVCGQPVERRPDSPAFGVQGGTPRFFPRK